MMTHRQFPVGKALAVVALLLLSRPYAVGEGKKSPPLVLLIRHAEKPPDEAMSIDLSPAGRKRAEALPGLFVKSAARPAPLPIPDFLFAAKDSKHSRRCAETVAPLAKKLGLKVNAKFANDDFAGLAAEVRRDPRYAGKTVLICWHHGNLAGLAKEFGVTGAEPWKGRVFDRVWRITYAPSGEAAADDLPQRLLPGDSKE